MKKKAIILVLVVFVLLAGAAAGIFFWRSSTSFEPTESAIYVKKNGKIIEAGIEDFDVSVYNATELETFVNKEVRNYNAKMSGDRIKVKEIFVENNIATMYLVYESYEDYQSFHGETLFVGSLTEALDAGYLEGIDFYSVYKGGIGVEVTLEDIQLSNDDFKVVVMEERVGIKVAGKVKYVSQNLTLVDDSMVEVLEDIQDTSEYIIVIYK